MKRIELNYSFNNLKKEIKIPFPFYRQHLHKVSQFATSIREPIFRVDVAIGNEILSEIRKLPVRKVTYKIV